MYIDGDINTRTCNKYQRGKETSKDSECASVVLIIQHAKRMRRILFYSLQYRNIT